MKIINIQSKSNPKIFRQVRVIDNTDGSTTYECSCPANVWFRVSKGKHGSANCHHIIEAWEMEENDKK
jgi:hypothetical protein